MGDPTPRVEQGKGEAGGGKRRRERKKKTPHTAQYFPCAAAEEEIASICYVQSRVSAQRPGKEGSLFPRWGGGAAGGSAEGRKVPPTAMRDRDGAGGGRAASSAGGGRSMPAGGSLLEEPFQRRAGVGATWVLPKRGGRYSGSAHGEGARGKRQRGLSGRPYFCLPCQHQGLRETGSLPSTRSCFLSCGASCALLPVGCDAHSVTPPDRSKGK